MKKQKLEKISDSLFNELTSRQVRLISGGEATWEMTGVDPDFITD